MSGLKRKYTSGDLEQIARLMPPILVELAMQIGTCSPAVARRRVVSRVGFVQSRETFADDVVDAVFMRIQERSQVGAYDSEDAIMALRRGAYRMEGDGDIVLYRAAPPGAEIRPGDFAAESRHEAGFYTHGGHKVIKMAVPRSDVFALHGSCGGGQEFIYLPKDYERPDVAEFFGNFATFYEFAKALSDLSMTKAKEAALATRKAIETSPPRPLSTSSSRKSGQPDFSM